MSEPLDRDGDNWGDKVRAAFVLALIARGVDPRLIAGPPPTPGSLPPEIEHAIAALEAEIAAIHAQLFDGRRYGH